MNKYVVLLPFVALGLPIQVLAQGGLQVLIIDFGDFLNNSIIPLIIAIALLSFLINTTRYFIIGASDVAARERAHQFALWSIIAFLLMVSIWGIVNMLVFGFGFGREQVVCPDYLEYCSSYRTYESGYWNIWGNYSGNENFGGDTTGSGFDDYYGDANRGGDIIGDSFDDYPGHENLGGNI